MAVHYKFNAAKEYDTLPVDGLHISLADLKEAIIHHKRLGKGDLCDLQVTNAETKETYTDDKALIPKNSSLIIARVPIDPSQKKNWDLSRDDKELLLSNPEYRMNTEGAEEANQLSRKLEEVPDLTKFVGTEEEKISAMIAQSTLDYHPSRYLKLRNTVMSGKVPPFYKCYKCHQGGHWVTNCPLNNQDLRKSTGIPSKFLIEVTDPNTPGVMITGVGKYVVFRQNLVMGEGTQAKVRPKCSENPPEELVCLLCKEMMQDAVLIPCCANAFCDDCLRNHLLDTDDHACPTCHETGIGPDTLVPNRYLRLKILQFGNQFLTELPDENVNGRSDSPSSLLPKSRSYPGTPVVVMSPADSPGITKSDSPQPNANTMKNSPRSPPVLSDLLIMEEEEKKRENKKSEDNDAAKEDEQGEQATAEETRRKERVEEEGESEMKEGLSQESLMTSPGSHIHEESESALSKSRKHGKKSKKKKDGEGKEKHKKKDKEKKKSKKKKESKEGMSEGDGDGLLNTSHDEGSEKVSDPLMNEAICPTFDPSVPPPGTMPVRPRPPPRYPANTVIPVLGAPYQPALQPFMMHSGRYGIQSQDDDPVTTFMRYLEKKDEQKRKRLRSKSSSRSPYRDRSRSRLQPVNSYSRSRSNSVSKAHSPSWNRKHHSGNSPRSRRRCSRSPASNSRHGYRSLSRERSPSLSRSPSPGRRLMSSPLASGHLYSSYSPHRGGMEKAREKKSFNAAPICGGDFGPYNYNSMYDCPVSIGGYGGPRVTGERGPPRESRHQRHYGYDTEIEMNPQIVPFKTDPRRGVSRRLIDDRRPFDDRSRSREDDWRRHRGLEEEEWNRRNPYSKGDRKLRYENRNRTSPPDTHRGRGREYENPKESLSAEGKHHRRDRRREIGEDHHSVAKSGSLSPPSHREERKRERKDSRKKGSRERVPEDEGGITDIKRTKEKSHRGKNKMSEEERTESVEKDRGGRGERVTGTRWGENKVALKESDPTTLKEIGSNTPPPPETESTTDKEEKGRKKHEKKKKKKEKRRSSQASQEEGCPSDAAIEDEKKTKKKDKEKKRLKKVQGGEEATKESANTGAWQSENTVQKEPPGEEEIQPIGKADTAPEEIGADPEAAFLPALSKWEREDEDVLSPLKASVDPEKKIEESLVTSDVIKRAENALFSKGLTNRALMPRKVYLEKSSREREREQQQDPQRSPTPEWQRADTREAKRKGGSIQITISSKTESQIGRPRFGKLDVLKETTSLITIDNLGITKLTETDRTGPIVENKGNVSRWDSAISPKRKEHVTLNVVKAKKVRLDTKDNVKKLEKRSANITTEEASCSGSSRETTDKQEIAIDQDNVFRKDGEIGHSSSLPHSHLNRGDSQEQVVSSTEEMRLPIEGQSPILCSDIESVSQSVPSHFDEAIKLTTSPDAVFSMEGQPSNEKVESDIEEGELVEEQPSEAVPDSTEDQLGREVRLYHDVHPISLDKESLVPSQDECGLPSEEIVQGGQVLGPGQEGSSLLSPPSPTIKRKANEVNLGDKKPKKKKKRKHSSSSSSTSTSSSSSSSDSSSEEESSKKKKKKKKKRKKKKAAADSESSDEDDTIKDKRKKKKKKKKKRKGEKSLEKAKLKIPWMQRECV